MDRILCFMFVFFGGGLGCLTRLLVDGTSTEAFALSNIAACILIGVTYGTARYGIGTNKYWLSFFNVGFLGGLSTFTPLALYSLSAQQDNIFMALVVMVGLLLAYTALTVASALITTAAVKAFTHGKYQLKMTPRASMRYIFTGHMHANDIAEYTTVTGNHITDLETGSLSSWRSPQRTVTPVRPAKLSGVFCSSSDRSFTTPPM